MTVFWKKMFQSYLINPALKDLKSKIEKKIDDSIWAGSGWISNQMYLLH
jgi:hypothetical protein